MKKIIFLLLFPIAAFAQLDQVPIIINISDNAALQYKGAAVKQQAFVTGYTPVISGTKDFSLTIVVKCYVNNAGAYGASILSDIASNVNLSVDQVSQLSLQYADRTVTYTTIGNCTDVSGNTVACSVGGAIPEIQYWQTFKLNQIPGMGTLAGQSAAGVQYLIITAIVNKLDTRKKW